MTSQQYAGSICPIFAPSNAYRGLNVRAIMDCYNIISAEKIATDRLTVGKFIGLPASVLAYYEAQFGKTGREMVKKAQAMPRKTKMGDLPLAKNAASDLILAGCWHTVKQIGFGHVLVFPFGCAFDAHEMSQSDMRSAMAAAIDWLSVKPRIEVKEIRI